MSKLGISFSFYFKHSTSGLVLGTPDQHDAYTTPSCTHHAALLTRAVLFINIVPSSAAVAVSSITHQALIAQDSVRTRGSGHEDEGERA